MIGSVIGVDPGGQHTGIVVVEDGRLTAKSLIGRDANETIEDYARYVARHVAGQADGRLVAVEGVRRPSPHLGMIDVTGLLDAAVVLGAVVASCDPVMVVPPAGHGSGPLMAYPAELVGPNEPAGTGRLKHCRSAWDVAHATAGIPIPKA